MCLSFSLLVPLTFVRVVQSVVMKRSLVELMAVIVVFCICGAILFFRFVPCIRPIPYSIVSVDTRFPVTKTEFTAAAAEAVSLWNNAAGKELFAVASFGGVEVSAVFDHRQEARDKLQTLGISLDAGEKSFNVLKGKYDALKRKFDTAEKEFSNLKQSYDIKKRVYDAAVDAAKGGASASRIQAIEGQRVMLNQMVDRLNAKQDALKPLADQVNALVTVLNRLAAGQHEFVGQFNQIGSSLGDTYQAALYRQSGAERSITVYSFETHEELVALLAHEFGHALGIPHLQDSTAIMYYLSEAGRTTLSASDRDALQNACSLWPVKDVATAP